jgi:hypothetical protein
MLSVSETRPHATAAEGRSRPTPSRAGLSGTVLQASDPGCPLAARLGGCAQQPPKAIESGAIKKLKRALRATS